MDLVTRLNYLFGGEKEVFRRRNVLLLRETFIEEFIKYFVDFLECKVISSGSRGEGLSYPPSDDDIMAVLPANLCLYSFLRVTPFDIIRMSDLQFVPSEYSPGFYLLRVSYFLNLAPSNTVPFFTLDIPTSIVMEELSGEGICRHGPCMNYKFGKYEFDIAVAIPCTQWPLQAIEWITRRRISGWPSRELIEAIVSNGCHFVPIGNPGSPVMELEWRLSFSLAERKLVHSFSHVQLLVYSLLKLCLKKVIDIQIPNALCSYYMKTVIFYSIETRRLDMWTPERINECFHYCLLQLYFCVDRLNCPNYFVPGNNMMRTKVNNRNRPPLLDTIRYLISCDVFTVLHICGESDIAERNISIADVEHFSDNDIFNSYQWRFMEFMLQTRISMCTNHGEITLMLKRILELFKFSFQLICDRQDSSWMKVLARRIITFMGMQAVHVSEQIPPMNKKKYCLLKYGKTMLRCGRLSDVSSGRLMLASYFYKVSRFQDALIVTQDVIAKQTPYVLCSSNISSRQEMYRAHICNRNLSLDQKARKAWSFDAKFPFDSIELAPTEVRLLIYMLYPSESLVSTFHPLIYAYFLEGLSLHKIGNIQQMNGSIESLKESLRVLDDTVQIFYGRHLIGRLKMLQRDYSCSYRFLASAFLLKEVVNLEYQPQQKYAFSIPLACLLNRLMH